MAKDIEIEIQVQLDNTKELISYLKKNAKNLGEKHQVDNYFVPAHRNFLKNRPVNEWLRLRNAGKKFWINYKNWHRNSKGQTLYADEYESMVEDINQLEKILKVLDFKEITTVDKTRQLWLYKDYEIAIDVIKRIGDFIEIEYKGNIGNQKPEEITRAMTNFLKKFNPGKIRRNSFGYPFQLLFPKEVVKEIV